MVFQDGNVESAFIFGQENWFIMICGIRSLLNFFWYTWRMKNPCFFVLFCCLIQLNVSLSWWLFVQTPFTDYSVVIKSPYRCLSLFIKSSLGQLPLGNGDLHAFLLIHVFTIKLRPHYYLFHLWGGIMLPNVRVAWTRVGQTGDGHELAFIPVCHSCTALAHSSHLPHEAEAGKTVHKAKNICE